MADKIKKFFMKKKEEAKFKLQLGGAGRKLNEPTPTTSKPPAGRDVYVPLKRDAPSNQAREAALAAMNRIDRPVRSGREFNTSLAAIQAQVKREMEAEHRAKSEKVVREEESKPQDVDVQKFAVSGVFFRCPMISEEILSKQEWKVKIKEFLYQQLDNERSLTACLIIHNCNTKDKATACIETLKKYLENLINFPDEEKYKKIRMTNRIFEDKVKNVEGSLEFLLSAGFVQQTIDGEEFLIWSADRLSDTNQLEVLFDALGCAESIQLELDRNIQVLLPSQVRRTDLPVDFYRMTVDEFKRDQLLKSQANESLTMLKTKAMREKEEQKALTRYRYALIRVRFPDGIYLQGIFSVYEKLSHVYEFVQSCLENESDEFTLSAPLGIHFSAEDVERTLLELKLVPNFTFNLNIQKANPSEENYVKKDLMMLIQSM